LIDTVFQFYFAEVVLNSPRSMQEPEVHEEAMIDSIFRATTLFSLFLLLSIANAQPVQLTTNATSDYHPEWTPDGQTVVFTVNNGSTISLASVDVSTRVVTPIEITGNGENDDFDFGISGDGTQIVFDARHPTSFGMVLYIVPIEGGAVQNPTGTLFRGVHPSWSPVDNKIVFHYNGLKILNLDNNYISTIIANSEEIAHPSFSYDGETVVFSNEINGNRDIYIMSADGNGEPERLTTDTAWDDRGTISPDGRYLAFYSDRSGNNDIWIKDLDDGELIQITTDPARDDHPAWSPDGSTIAFVSNRDNGDWDIWTLNVEQYVSVEEEKHGVLPSKAFRLNTYPNPFNDTVRITIADASSQSIDLAVYNMMGQRVWNRSGLSLKSGSMSIHMKAEDISAGTYILYATTDGFDTLTHKLVYLK